MNVLAKNTTATKSGFKILLRHDAQLIYDFTKAKTSTSQLLQFKNQIKSNQIMINPQLSTRDRNFPK